MCIAILKPKNKTIKKEHLENSFYSNDDGAGFMFNHDNKLHIYKGFMDFESFWNSFSSMNTKDKTCLIHFRIKTHGAISKENCHPFLVSDKLGFIHNGIIKIKTKGVESDTMAFNRNYLKPIPKLERIISNQSIKKLISNRINKSKLVFLDNRGRYTIINHDLGQWYRGSWFSNGSFKSSKAFCFTGFDDYIEYSDYSCICGNNLVYDDEINEGLCSDCIGYDFNHNYKNKENIVESINKKNKGRYF